MATRNSEIINLILRAREGDGQALGKLLDLHRDYLKGLAAQQLNPKLQRRLDDSDVIQQTCLSVHKQIGGFQGNDPAEFVAWLRLIHERNIQNVARDQMQVQKRAASREESLEPADVAGPQTTPSQIVMREEEATQLKQAMQSLPADERDVVELRYFKDWSVSQIAEHLALTPDAVAWRLKRGMKAMKSLLKDDAS